MSELSVRSTPIGGGALARAAIAGELPAWYPPPPRDADGWRDRVRDVAGSASQAWLEQLAPAFGGNAASAAATRLARAASQGGAVVTTGQQPGLFGGPIYTWSKAVAALALADALEEATGIPVAPVFWAATDDADLAEASTTWVAQPDGAAELRMSGVEDEGRSMADVPLPDLAVELMELARACGSAADPLPLDLVRRAYTRGATVGTAYVELLRGLLEPLGISVLDASHPAVRSTSGPLLRDALRSASAADTAIRERSAAIEGAGYSPQVAVVDGLTPVFVYEQDGRRRVPLTEASRVADSESAVLGPNVLLRPVIERAILPTVTYVAGPGELAYFAQVSALAAALELPIPMVVPRWSTTLLEPEVIALLERYELTVDSLADKHGPERDLAARLLPESVRAPIEALRHAVATQTALLATATGTDGEALLPTTVADGAERDIARRLERLERRYRAAVKRREEGTFTDIARLRGSLRPGGAPQERALNILPFLARYGSGVLSDMKTVAREYADELVGIIQAARSREEAGR